MGYKVPRDVFKLIFAQHDGLEIRITSPSVGEVMSVMKLIKYKGIDPQKLSEADIEDFRRPQKIFAKHLISWNLLDDDDEPIPATLEGVESLPRKFFEEITNAWVNNTAGVPKDSPLDSRLADGLLFPEDSIPVEPRLPSL